MGRMTSTASNTFIEEENVDLVEITAVSSVSSVKSTASRNNNDPAYVTQAAAAKISEMTYRDFSVRSLLISFYNQPQLLIVFLFAEEPEIRTRLDESSRWQQNLSTSD